MPPDQRLVLLSTLADPVQARVVETLLWRGPIEYSELRLEIELLTNRTKSYAVLERLHERHVVQTREGLVDLIDPHGIGEAIGCLDESNAAVLGAAARISEVHVRQNRYYRQRSRLRYEALRDELLDEAAAAGEGAPTEPPSEVIQAVPAPASREPETEPPRAPPVDPGRSRVAAVTGLAEMLDGAAPNTVFKKPLPDVLWISVSDGTRQRGDLEDRAARYYAGERLLTINADFRLFVAVVDFWASRYTHLVAGPTYVSAVVREWYGTLLQEVVVGIEDLADSPAWSDHDVALAVSPMGLTTAVFPKLLVMRELKKVLAQRLGRLPSAQRG